MSPKGDTCWNKVENYNSYGQVKETVVKTSDNKTCQTSSTYSTTGSIFGAILTSTDVRGKVTRFFYDTSKARLVAEIAPDGNGTCYTYDAKGNLTLAQPATCSSSTSWSAVANSAEVSYTYNSLNQLATISNDGTTYTFAYDLFGDTSSIKIGSTTITSQTKNANNGKVNKVTYGNGITVNYEYDVLDRVSKITYNSGSTVLTTYIYEYDANGNLAKVIDSSSNRKTLYKYDLGGRMIGYIETDTSASDNIFQTWYEYDDKSHLSEVIYVQDYAQSSNTYHSIQNYVYSYNNFEQLSSIEIKQTAETALDAYFVTLLYDTFDRIITKEVKITNNSGSTNRVRIGGEYTYITNGSGLISKYITKVNGSTVSTYNYTYDNNGNITQITNANGTIQWKYTYDSLGRLTREDNRAASRTYVYTYNVEGNILKKTTYGFTTASGTPTTTLYSTYNYAYSDGDWRDKLTIYRNTSMTYDAIGNPLSYFNGTSMTMTWVRGRELATVTKGSDTIAYTYGASGLRISKTVNGVVHKYIYDGDMLISEQFGDTLLIYVYDEAGSPIGFKYRTTGYAIGAFDNYVFGKNLQGDIVAIYNTRGTSVATYKYDAWGNVISATGTMASVNPFRYRGYYYDTETGFYYLQSRYYDPEIGRFINADVY